MLKYFVCSKKDKTFTFYLRFAFPCVNGTCSDTHLDIRAVRKCLKDTHMG